jgi:hypothetical protein
MPGRDLSEHAFPHKAGKDCGSDPSAEIIGHVTELFQSLRQSDQKKRL